MNCQHEVRVTDWKSRLQRCQGSDWVVARLPPRTHRWVCFKSSGVGGGNGTRRKGSPGWPQHSARAPQVPHGESKSRYSSIECFRIRVASSPEVYETIHETFVQTITRFLAHVLPYLACVFSRLPLDPPASSAAILPLNSNLPTPLTGKERLGRKWMDEQRIDNCNVPVDKRGAKPRPALVPCPDRRGRAEEAPANALCR